MIKIIFQIAMPLDSLKELKESKFDDLKEDPDLSGYFKIETDDFNFGFAQSKPIEVDEQGWDLPRIWLKHLLTVIEELPSKRYIAISNIETPDVYLEFSLDDDDKVTIKDIRTESNSWILYEKPQTLEIKNQTKKSISFDEIKKVLLQSRDQFLSDLSKINPLYLKVDEIKKLSSPA